MGFSLKKSTQVFEGPIAIHDIQTDGAGNRGRDGRYFDLHLVHLREGKNYRIVMFPTANQFAPSITVEDFQGAKLRVGGDNIGFAASRTGMYRVLAMADQPGKTGSYRLTFNPK